MGRKPKPFSRNGNSWITLSMNSIPGLPRTAENPLKLTFHWKKWNLLWENSRTSSNKRKSSLKICNYFTLSWRYFQPYFDISVIEEIHICLRFHEQLWHLRPWAQLSLINSGCHTKMTLL